MEYLPLCFQAKYQTTQEKNSPTSSMIYIRGGTLQCDSDLTTQGPHKKEDLNKECYICDEAQKYGTNERCNVFKSSYTAPNMAKHTCIHIQNSKSSNQANKPKTSCVLQNTLKDYTNNTLDNDVLTPKFKFSQRIARENRGIPCWTHWRCRNNMFSKNEKVLNVLSLFLNMLNI